MYTGRGAQLAQSFGEAPGRQKAKNVDNAAFWPDISSGRINNVAYVFHHRLAERLMTKRFAPGRHPGAKVGKAHQKTYVGPAARRAVGPAGDRGQARGLRGDDHPLAAAAE